METNTMNEKKGKHQVVIIGGGAAGLELATSLGKKLGKKGLAEITLLDASHTHIWKPLLHEIAAGTLGESEKVEYLAQAYRAGFRFRLGRMDGINRKNREISVAPTLSRSGEELIPRRTFSYDTLVMAVGSVSNTFNIDGVSEHCQFLDSTSEAFEFQQQLVETYIKSHVSKQSKLSIGIIGAGATGVELAAQLHEVAKTLAIYGLDTVKDVQITIVEAAPRLLPALPDRLSMATQQQLAKSGIDLRLGCRVVEVTQAGIKTREGELIPAELKVWAAGIKAPEWFRDLDGLELNSVNQLLVEQTLKTTDDDVFAMGDCAACLWPGHEGNVPPRAQAAHQQASTLAKSIINRVSGNGELQEFTYHDYGSLVSLGKYSTVGNLMGNLLGTVSIGGLIARVVYLSLYKMHQVAVHGYYRTAMLTLSNLFRHSVYRQIKLH
jgi:NADH dehydrogenase